MWWLVVSLGAVNGVLTVVALSQKRQVQATRLALGNERTRHRHTESLLIAAREQLAEKDRPNVPVRRVAPTRVMTPPRSLLREPDSTNGFDPFESFGFLPTQVSAPSSARSLPN